MANDADARRVALLARQGPARERLSSVLEEAGANCVITADPTELSPAELRDLHPQVVLVALDPLTEEVLEQFDSVLGDPSIDVIYEEAEQAAAREGWDAARWQRHLVAKLQGHANVLPPGRPSAPVSAPAEAAPAVDVPVIAAGNAFDPVNAELDGFDPAIDFGSPSEPLPEFGVTSSSADLSLESFEIEGLAAQMPGQEDPAALPPYDDASAFDFSFETTAADVPAGVADASVFDALDAVDAFHPLNADAVDEGPVVPMEALSLQHEELEADPQDTVESRDAFRHDLNDLEQRISTMSLVDDSPRKGPEQARGAVLVLSGLGGPDAVRQLLGALPADFARPVLVQQHLDGGRYDKLVTQLQRATKLPVKLAEPAQLAAAGTIYILPEAMGATSSDEGIRFSDDANHAVLAALPSPDSAVLMLSGSDPVHVDAVMAHSWAGALVAGQAAEGCYDPAAPNALAARGGDVAVPAALALRLSARWSTRGSSHVQA